jgi:phosphate transport system substrate-binding protein
MFVPSTQFIVDEVAQNPAAIGYIGLGYLGDAVKAVNLLAGESGVPISVIDGHRDGLPYPLTRDFFFYLVGGREGAADDYIEFVLGNTGQEIVRELNFVPVGE